MPQMLPGAKAPGYFSIFPSRQNSSAHGFSTLTQERSLRSRRTVRTVLTGRLGLPARRLLFRLHPLLLLFVSLLHLLRLLLVLLLDLLFSRFRGMLLL
jgi:hypothetical protein